jgi:CheY-like chemotaxis protein
VTLPHPSVIMVIDDEQDILSIIERALKKYGYTIEAFSSPVKALESFMSNPSQYDLVITDIRMPGLSGLELAQRVRQMRQDLKILFMTAYMAEEIRYGLPGNMIYKRDVIEKPFNIGRICDEVRLRLLPMT